MLFNLLIASMAFASPQKECNKYCEKRKPSKALVYMKKVYDVLDMYIADCDKYPTTDQGLDALLNEPQYGPKCRQWGPVKYIKNLKKDPWGRPFIYESDGTYFRLISLGADKREGGEGLNSDLLVQVGHTQ